MIQVWGRAVVIFGVLTLTACGLDVTFEPENRDAIESYDPDRDREGLVPDDDVNNNSEPGPQTRLTSFQHAGWGALLRGYLAGSCVDYDALGGSPEAMDLLGKYTDQLGRADLSSPWPESTRTAFWINAYNALTVSGVVAERRGSASFQVDEDAFVFFEQRRWEVGGMVLSLNLIEHGILRGDADHQSMTSLTDEAFKARIMAEHEKIGGFDPRVHFALNCASRSCPDLRAEPYLGDKLEAQLEAQAMAFLLDPSKGAGPEGISQLFSWFAPDFEMEASIPDFIEGLRPGGLEGVKLDSFLVYSWEPNDVDSDLAQCKMSDEE